jgi:hypothetical protein
MGADIGYRILGRKPPPTMWSADPEGLVTGDTSEGDA